jgi:5'-deoxynucleotidase YfbR-like HD superfamily hydrolase
MRIYYQIWGPLNSDVSTYIIFHDSGELVTGDMPFPVKMNNPDLKAAADRVEAEGLRDMGITLTLGPHQRQQVKICDVIDMYEQGLYECAVGNKFAEPIVNDTFKTIAKLASKFPSADDYRRIDEYVWRVTKELAPERL